MHASYSVSNWERGVGGGGGERSHAAVAVCRIHASSRDSLKLYVGMHTSQLAGVIRM